MIRNKNMKDVQDKKAKSWESEMKDIINDAQQQLNTLNLEAQNLFSRKYSEYEAVISSCNNFNSKYELLKALFTDRKSHIINDIGDYDVARILSHMMRCELNLKFTKQYITSNSTLMGYVNHVYRDMKDKDVKLIILEVLAGGNIVDIYETIQDSKIHMTSRELEDLLVGHYVISYGQDKQEAIKCRDLVRQENPELAEALQNKYKLESESIEYPIGRGIKGDKIIKAPYIDDKFNKDNYELSQPTSKTLGFGVVSESDTKVDAGIIFLINQTLKKIEHERMSDEITNMLENNLRTLTGIDLNSLDSKKSLINSINKNLMQNDSVALDVCKIQSGNYTISNISSCAEQKKALGALILNTLLPEILEEVCKSFLKDRDLQDRYSKFR